MHFCGDDLFFQTADYRARKNDIANGTEPDDEKFHVFESGSRKACLPAGRSGSPEDFLQFNSLKPVKLGEHFSSNPDSTANLTLNIYGHSSHDRIS